MDAKTSVLLDRTNHRSLNCSAHFYFTPSSARTLPHTSRNLKQLPDNSKNVDPALCGASERGLVLMWTENSPPDHAAKLHDPSRNRPETGTTSIVDTVSCDTIILRNLKYNIVSRHRRIHIVDGNGLKSPVLILHPILPRTHAVLSS